MFDQEDIKNLASLVKKSNEERDALNKLNRDIITLSKKAIVAITNNQRNEAETILEEMKAQVKQLVQYPLKNNTIGLQEYVEALAYYHYALHQTLLPYARVKELTIDHESYLKGIFDFIGELVRKAVLSAIKGDYKAMEEIYGFVSALYDQFASFSFHGELRKGYDSMRWNLKKLEAMMFEIKLRGKIHEDVSHEDTH